MSGGSGSCGSCGSAFVLIEEAFDELEGIFYRTVVLCVSSSFEVSSSFLLFIRLPTGIRRPPGVD